MLIAGIEVILSYIPANSLIWWLGLRNMLFHLMRRWDKGIPEDICSGSLAATVNQLSVLCWEDHWKSDLFQSHLQQIFDNTS